MFFAFLLFFTIHDAASQGNTIEDTLKIVSGTCDCNRPSDLDVSEIKVYTFNYQTGINDSSRIGDATNTILQDMIQNQCIDIFIPGFNSGITSSTVQDALCVFSQIKCNGMNTFGIIFDHFLYTGVEFLDFPDAYIKAVNYSKSIGERIGQMLAELLNEVDGKNINISGHSLGGHILGYAAETVKSIREPLTIIYAADPAGPCFENCPGEHVRSGQAGTVVTFHCSTPLGSRLKIADYDIYANGGVVQPGCLGLLCNHNKCVPTALLPAVIGGWISTRCDCFFGYKNGLCNRNVRMPVGYKIYPTNRPGTYYFNTPADLKCYSGPP